MLISPHCCETGRGERSSLAEQDADPPLLSNWTRSELDPALVPLFPMGSPTRFLEHNTRAAEQVRTLYDTASNGRR